MKVKKKRKTRKKRITKEALSIIQELMDKHGNSKNAFGFHSPDDIKQEIYLLCYQIYQKYDKDKGELRNFMEKSLLNRLKNLRRDLYFRPTPPCVTNKCPMFTGEENIECRKECKIFLRYQEMIKRRMNLMNMLSIDDVDDEFVEISNKHCADLSFRETMRYNDLLDAIISQLPKEALKHFDSLLEGKKIPFKFRRIIRSVARGILIEERYGANNRTTD